MKITSVIAKLREIANNPEYPIESRGKGLCTLIHKLNSSDYLGGLFTQCLASWPHYTGNQYFPVPSPLSDGDHGGYYLRCEDKWEGLYGDLRRDLCRHFADYLETVKFTEG